MNGNIYQVSPYEYEYIHIYQVIYIYIYTKLAHMNMKFLIRSRNPVELTIATPPH